MTPPGIDAHDATTETTTTGLTVSLRSVSAGAVSGPPIVSAGATINTAALWITAISFVSDQGPSDLARLRSLPFDAQTTSVDQTLAAAPPGLYSLVRVELGTADGAPLPAGFANQRLSLRTTGLLASGRAFTISDVDAGSVDLRASAPMELKPGAGLHVAIDVDVGAWLNDLSFDSGDSSEPFVVGPEGDGGFRDDFRANVLASFHVSLAE
jgi:hypothetical protein